MGRAYRVGLSGVSVYWQGPQALDPILQLNEQLDDFISFWEIFFFFFWPAELTRNCFVSHGIHRQANTAGYTSPGHSFSPASRLLGNRISHSLLGELGMRERQNRVVFRYPSPTPPGCGKARGMRDSIHLLTRCGIFNWEVSTKQSQF